MTDTEPRYTLNEAAQLLAEQECRSDGHDLEQIRSGAGEMWPFCSRCHLNFLPVPDRGVDRVIVRSDVSGIDVGMERHDNGRVMLRVGPSKAAWMSPADSERVGFAILAASAAGRRK